MRTPGLWLSLVGLVLTLALGACAGAGSRPPSGGEGAVVGDLAGWGSWDGTAKTESRSRFRAAMGTRGMVVSDDAVASAWGAEVLRQGGNAVDAAVATAFVLAVTRPHFGSLGGGGFLLYCPAKTPASACRVVDYRERAPFAVKPETYLRDGKPSTALSQDGALASGTPGVVAGLLKSLELFGRMKSPAQRRLLLSKPLALARHGIAWSSYSEIAATERWSAMNTEARRLFGCGSASAPCAPGARVRQPELARVLEAVGREGRDGFYRGQVARKLVAGLRAAGGILSLEDLEKYEPVLREPVRGEFGGATVVSLPPPSAGGTLLLQMLGYVERARRAGQLGAGDPLGEGNLRVLAHAMGLAFADRTRYFGDPGWTDVPVQRLLAPAYLDQRWATFDAGRAALPSAPGDVADGKHLQTTHLSVVDAEGNAVALTTTVNDNFGSGFVPPGTGVVMNNEMDDFALAPGTANLFGLTGGVANAVAPGKRPLSSMTATIVKDERGENRLVLGAAGGPRITTAVFQALVHRLVHGVSLTDAVAMPRIHEQWQPATLRVERGGLSAATLARLRESGYAVEETGVLGRLHALERFPANGRSWGVPDRRAEGAAAAE